MKIKHNSNLNKFNNEKFKIYPDEIKNLINEYYIFKPKFKSELQTAVDLWCTDKEKALELYNHISIWNTSLITDMSFLFSGKIHFNENINNWDVSSVKNMSYMFDCAKSFNQPLNNWNVSKVENIYSMFYAAGSFNQDISQWNVSNVKKFHYIFGCCPFNGDISKWKLNIK